MLSKNKVAIFGSSLAIVLGGTAVAAVTVGSAASVVDRPQTSDRNVSARNGLVRLTVNTDDQGQSGVARVQAVSPASPSAGQDEGTAPINIGVDLGQTFSRDNSGQSNNNEGILGNLLGGDNNSSQSNNNDGLLGGLLGNGSNFSQGNNNDGILGNLLGNRSN